MSSDTSPDIQMKEMPTFTKAGHILFRQGKLNEPHLPKGKGIIDLPLHERRKYLDPNQDHTHHSVTQTDTTCRCDEIHKAKEQKAIDNEKKAARHEKKIADQEDTIALLTKHLTDLTNQVNELTKQMKK
jgi:hypothetical protein